MKANPPPPRTKKQTRQVTFLFSSRVESTHVAFGSVPRSDAFGARLALRSCALVSFTQLRHLLRSGRHQSDIVSGLTGGLFGDCLLGNSAPFLCIVCVCNVFCWFVGLCWLVGCWFVGFLACMLACCLFGCLVVWLFVCLFVCLCLLARSLDCLLL